MKGRPPKPTALKVLEGGTPGSVGKSKRRLPEGEPQPKVLSILPDPPTWLDARARELWADRGPTIRALGLLTEADIEKWAMFCQRMSDVERLAVEAREVPGYEAGPEEVERVRKERREARAEYNKAVDSARQLGADFGLDPAARTKINVKTQEQTPRDRLEALVAKKTS